jgi:hypothetical protein
MNFRQFIEGKLGSFTYEMPRDKEQQLYDFYMLSALKGSGDPHIEEAVRWTRQKLLPALKKELLKAVFFSLMSEFRHAGYRYFDMGDYEREIFEDQDLIPYRDVFYKYLKLFKQYWQEGDTPPEAMKQHEGEDYNRIASYAAAKGAGPRWKMVRVVEEGFTDLSWEAGYGGIAWSKIARGWLKLNGAKDLDDMQVWIDHVYDLQHNNDTVFNKLMEYYKDGHRWIMNALNHKARIKSPWELQDKISDSMKRLAGYVFKGNVPAYQKRSDIYGTAEDWKARGEHEYPVGSYYMRLTPHRSKDSMGQPIQISNGIVHRSGKDA